MLNLMAEIPDDGGNKIRLHGDDLQVVKFQGLSTQA